MEVIRRVFTDNELRLEVKKGQRVIGDVHMGVNFRHDPSQAEMLTDGDGEGLADEALVVDTTLVNSDIFGPMREWGGKGGLPLGVFSRKAGTNRIAADTRSMVLAGVGESQLGFNAWSLLQQAKNEDVTYDMVEFRLSVLRAIAADPLKDNIQTYSDLWREEEDIAAAMSSVIAKENDFGRLYVHRGTKREVLDIRGRTDQFSILNDEGMYYQGNEVSGLLTTTEQLFAVFAVQAALSGEDAMFRLCEASRRYVDIKYMNRILRLAEKTLAALGSRAASGKLILVDRNSVASATNSSKTIYQMLEETTL